MILVTGGLGFIGSHTVRALLDAGESCVVAQRRADRIPDFIQEDVGRRVLIELLDVADGSALRALGQRQEITGIVHLAAPGLGTLGPFEDLRVNISGLLNVLEVAALWGARRVTIASTIGVYAGATPRDHPLPEDMPLPMVGSQPIETSKKSFELLSTFLAGRAGLEVANVRLSAVWGPLGRTRSAFFAVPQLVHSAVRNGGAASDTTQPLGYADDGIDLCYVRDCARAIALLQTAERLHHQTYNVGSGRVTANREVVAAIRRVVPGADLELAEGHDPYRAAPNVCLDTSRLRLDTGYEPAWGLDGVLQTTSAGCRQGTTGRKATADAAARDPDRGRVAPPAAKPRRALGKPRHAGGATSFARQTGSPIT